MAERGSKPDLLMQVPAVAWERLGQMRILFGHQSVGFNIIDGMTDMMKDYPAIRLDLIEIKSPPVPSNPAFVHFRVGRNGEPTSKIDDFARYVDAGASPDIAFFKFCFADANAGTDVEAIFAGYKRTLSGLEQRHPGTTFIHVTMPLTTIQAGWKVPIKRLIGRPVDGCAENVKRNQFNELLKTEYGGKAPIFDVAAAESALPDGSLFSFSQEGRTYSAMFPGHTTDGGHLNEAGRRIVAGQLLALLGGIAQRGR